MSVDEAIGDSMDDIWDVSGSSGGSGGNNSSLGSDFYSNYHLDYNSDFDVGDLDMDFDYDGDNSVEGYAVFGGGFSFVPLLEGLEVSGGIYGNYDNTEIGIFICFGVGMGFNVSYDYYLGTLDEIPSGEYYAHNFVLGPVSISGFDDDLYLEVGPMLDNFADGRNITLGYGGGVPIGSSVSYGNCYNFKIRGINH